MVQPRPRRAAPPSGWTLSLGWPNLTALAAAALAGFIIGLSGLDSTFRYGQITTIEGTAESGGALGEAADGNTVGEEALW